MKLKPLDEMTAEGGEWHGLDPEKLIEKMGYAVQKGGAPMTGQEILLHIEQSVDWVFNHLLAMMVSSFVDPDDETQQDQARKIITEAQQRYGYQKLARLYEFKRQHQQRQGGLVVPTAVTPQDLQ